MRGETSYCDTCGSPMSFSEVNMSYNQYTCHSCGNTFTSHVDSNCLERLQSGRQLHYNNLINAFDRATKFLETEQDRGGKEEIEIAERRMERAQKDLNDFRQEEIKRVSALLPANSSDELIECCSPFGTEILDDVRKALGEE